METLVNKGFKGPREIRGKQVTRGIKAIRAYKVLEG
jgi:hypothetical protein